MDNLSFLHGGNIYRAKEKYKGNVIDFSANINPLGLPQEVKKEILKNFNLILHYPDVEAKKITKRIAQYWQIKEENILVGNGSVELIYSIIFAFKPEKVLIFAPTFSEYEQAVRKIGKTPRFFKLTKERNFKLDFTQLPHSSKFDIIFICNPNNPTGNLLWENPFKIKDLSGKFLVVDEAFMDFLPTEKNHTLIWEAVKNKHLMVLRTFTKFFALPGLRIGYVVAHKEIISKLKSYQIPWNVNTLAQTAAEVILKDKEYIRRTRKFIAQERAFLFTKIENIKGLRPYPSVTNFLLIELNSITSHFLISELFKKGILIRDCSNFRYLNNKFIRLAIRNHQENLYLLENLKSLT